MSFRQKTINNQHIKRIQIRKDKKVVISPLTSFLLFIPTSQKHALHLIMMSRSYTQLYREKVTQPFWTNINPLGQQEETKA